MNTFSYIIYFFITGNRNFQDEKMKRDLIKGDIVTYSFLCSLHDKGAKKLVWLVNTITNAVFIQPDKKERIQEAFYKAQVVYHGMSRLARHFKMKRARVFDVQHDLCLNPLSELRPNMVYRLYDDKNRTWYSFRISDLINVINTALMHSPEFFADPQPIRNPYTNIELTNAQLYSLYFAVKESPYVMPVLFHQYFDVEFDLLRFCKLNECYIREAAIKSFIRNASIQQKYRYILKMFVDYKRQLEGIVIHDEFPKKTLVGHFSKYLPNYLMECYSLNPAMRHISKRTLKGDLILFKTLNPQYGRKIASYKQIASDLSKTSNSQNTFVFGENISPTTFPKQKIVYTFVDKVITEPPRVRRVRSRPTRGETLRRERRAAQIRNRRRTSESRRAMNELVDTAFSMLRMTTDHNTVLAITGASETGAGASETDASETDAITEADGTIHDNNNNDSDTESESDGTMDIDLLIDMMNSDESTIESGSDTDDED